MLTSLTSMTFRAESSDFYSFIMRLKQYHYFNIEDKLVAIDAISALSKPRYCFPDTTIHHLQSIEMLDAYSYFTSFFIKSKIYPEQLISTIANHIFLIPDENYKLNMLRYYCDHMNLYSFKSLNRLYFELQKRGLINILYLF